jgi:hypothetical protein
MAFKADDNASSVAILLVAEVERYQRISQKSCPRAGCETTGTSICFELSTAVFFPRRLRS